MPLDNYEQLAKDALAAAQSSETAPESTRVAEVYALLAVAQAVQNPSSTEPPFLQFHGGGRRGQAHFLNLDHVRSVDFRKREGTSGRHIATIWWSEPTAQSTAFEGGEADALAMHFGYTWPADEAPRAGRLA